jgi:hypothetical protein
VTGRHEGLAGALGHKTLRKVTLRRCGAFVR